jgi:hypothetical protein
MSLYKAFSSNFFSSASVQAGITLVSELARGFRKEEWFSSSLVYEKYSDETPLFGVQSGQLSIVREVIEGLC